MNSEMATDQDYRVWIGELKSKFRQAQLTAAIKVNSTLLAFYWELGADIVAKQRHSVWGEGFLTQLSRDLMTEFPEVKGFSKRNLEQIRRWYYFWQGDSAIAQQAASQITQIPWWHNVIIASKNQTQQEALYYVANTLKHGWSRSVLTHQIESRLWHREGKATHNFAQTLPTTQSDLAQQTLKDPYVFDFLSLTQEHNEREFRFAHMCYVIAIKLRNTLVPKLQLGNPGGEASASRDGKLELPALNSQAGAWELAQNDCRVLVSYAFPRGRDCESIHVGEALASTFGAKAPPTINKIMTYKLLNMMCHIFKNTFTVSGAWEPAQRRAPERKHLCMSRYQLRTL